MPGAYFVVLLRGCSEAECWRSNTRHIEIGQLDDMQDNVRGDYTLLGKN